MTSADATPAFDERIFDELLDLIEEERVVPIIGQELLRIEVGGESVLLYQLLARRLATALGLACGPTPTLNDVACEYLRSAKDANDLTPIYRGLKRLLQEDMELPKSLLQLAEIEKLSFFVTTTFDPLMVRALDRVKFPDGPRTQAYTYTLDGGEDVPRAIIDSRQKVVYYLFGRVSSSPQFAVTDEELLEYIHSLSVRAPQNLFNELDSRHLLIMGSNFSDWLARFFIRSAKRNRLWLARQRPDFVADSQMARDTSLASFIEHYGSPTRVIPGDPVMFVDELHRRWKATRKLSPTSVNERLRLPEKAIFISYARDDVAVATAIHAQLDRAGLDCWLDCVDLEAGDDFERIIKANIRNASMFLPVISRSAVEPERRYLRLEWHWAEREAIMRGRRYLCPVVIDNTSPDHEMISDVFRHVHWENAPNGQLSPDFIDALIRRMKELS